MEIEPGTLVGSQTAPVVVHRIEHRLRCPTRRLRLDHQGEPARKVGVLQPHDSGVTRVQVLHRIHCGWVEPTRACRDRDDEQGALETTGPFQFVQGDPGTLLQTVARVEPGVYPDGTLRFTPEERRDICLSRSIENEALPIPSYIIPFDE